MSRVHPSTYFIKYLMTQGTRDSSNDAWVNGMLSTYGCYDIGDTSLAAIRQEVEQDRPVDFRPRDRSHRLSMKYLRDHQVYSMHFPNKHVELMREQIVLVPSTRELVERMLLGQLEERFVSARLNKRYGLFLTSRAVKLYKHYFFNTGVVGMDDLEYYLRQDNDEGLRFAIAKVGAPLALYRSGVRQQIESKTIIKKAQVALFMTLLEIDKLPLSQFKVEALSRVTNTLLRVDERLSQSDLALREVLSEFERFRIKKRSDREVPKSIDEIAPQGAFSGSGADAAKKLTAGKKKQEVGK